MTHLSAPSSLEWVRGELCYYCYHCTHWTIITHLHDLLIGTHLCLHLTVSPHCDSPEGPSQWGLPCDCPLLCMSGSQVPITELVTGNCLNPDDPTSRTWNDIFQALWPLALSCNIISNSLLQGALMDAQPQGGWVKTVLHQVQGPVMPICGICLWCSLGISFEDPSLIAALNPWQSRAGSNNGNVNVNNSCGVWRMVCALVEAHDLW